LLSSSSWPGIPYPPSSQVLGLHVCTTTPDIIIYCWKMPGELRRCVC
jgi:hypothetical protein